MSGLKLLALDEEDLDIVSAHMQDSVFKVAECAFDARTRQFSLTANRFVWETASEKGRPLERRKAALVFKRVSAVKSAGVDRKNKDAVLDLLAIRFEKQGGAGRRDRAGSGRRRRRAAGCGMYRSAACRYRRRVGNEIEAAASGGCLIGFELNRPCPGAGRRKGMGHWQFGLTGARRISRRSSPPS